MVDLLPACRHLLRARRETIVTSAPSRSAMRAESMVTFPPPMIATRQRPMGGASNSGNRYAFIRFERMKYSLAK